MSLTVLCVFVSGHVPFTSEYVTRLRSMAEKTLPRHRFVCLTNREKDLPGDIERIRVEHDRGIFGWWSKINLFNKNLPVEGRLVYFDLDILLLGGLEQIIHYKSPFALAPDGAPHFFPRNGKACVKRFNSSVMVWDHGRHPEIYDKWNVKVADRLWGDQDWIGEQCPQADAMPKEWFPRLSELVVNGSEPEMPHEAKVILCKKPKNADAMLKHPWFARMWQ